jgi:hypothetical protein
MSAQPDIRICEDAAALAQQTTDLFVRLAQESVAARGRFTSGPGGREHTESRLCHAGERRLP